MPPQTQTAPAGFRYTPPSYLLRSGQQQKQEREKSSGTISTASMSTASLRSTESKPWNVSEENDLVDVHQVVKVKKDGSGTIEEVMFISMPPELAALGGGEDPIQQLLNRLAQ